MPPPMLEAYADEMPVIIAEEQLRATTAIAFASPAQSEQEVERREGILQRWYDLAYNRRQDGETDAEGRKILHDFTQVRDFLAWGMMAS